MTASAGKPAAVILLLAGLLAVASVAAIGIGSVAIPPGRVLAALLGGDLGNDGAELQSVDGRIVRDVRLPRVVLAMVVGAALAVAGAAFQALLRNPLADPFILGTSSGAALTATIMIATGAAAGVIGAYLLPLASFGGALAALVFVYLLARLDGRVPIEVLLLSGVIVNAFLFALVLVVLAVAEREAMEILLWLMGSLALGARPGLLASVAALVVVGTLYIYGTSRDLDAMSLGEEQAALLGVDTERLKRRLFVVVSLVVGAAVSVSGIIGFVGLIVPHLTRMLVGPRSRLLIPAAALLGALALVVADTIARTLLAPVELPVGVVTALAGGPFFVLLLRRSRRVL